MSQHKKLKAIGVLSEFFGVPHRTKQPSECFTGHRIDMITEDFYYYTLRNTDFHIVIMVDRRFADIDVLEVTNPNKPITLNVSLTLSDVIRNYVISYGQHTQANKAA